ncbi:MAG TPA: hypothetical protein VHS31_07485 [Tepidisphaeraceae bacterium]|jgi:hypothetical protein|nr:hypothetical protein [Tepidisphaeraceae bacterium]
MNTPVAMLVFNRPEPTQRVFNAIRAARPARLLIVADGPRDNRPGEADRCRAVREIVAQVDWQCDVQHNFAEQNMGCKRRVVSGISWVFEQVERAIILEDDCLPHPSFFSYCEELLERYKDDTRVMTICGDNFLSGQRRSSDSYFFMRYAHIWGWASWRRAWKFYDPDMKVWPQVRDGGWLKDIFREPVLVDYWRRMMQHTFDGNIDTWDYQWIFTLWVNSGLAVIPNNNMISNIGFGPDAAHTRGYVPYAEKPLQETPFPLKHPSFVIRDSWAEKVTEQGFYLPPRLPERLRRKLVRVARSFRGAKN